MSDQVQDAPLSQQVKILLDEQNEKGEYVTVRFAAKKLNVAQTDIRDNLPEGYKLEPSKDGTLSQARIVEGSNEVKVIASPEVVVTPVFHNPKPKKESKKKMSEQAIAENEMDGTPMTEEEIAQAEADGVELETCIICGNKVRKTTETIRGICPLCFRQLVKNSGLKRAAIEALSDEDFQILVGQELGRRTNMVDYRESRKLTAEEFEARKEDLIPVKEVFAAAKEKGYGPGRTAQAMGGDRLRHEPLGGFGSVWTPYYVGARSAWYFEKDILNHLDELAKPKKEPKEKKTRTRKNADGDPIARDGARGAEMVPVIASEDD